MNEEWKQIKDNPEYFISNFGRVWSAKSGKILIPHIRSKTSPYLFVGFSYGYGNMKKANIHRLVAEAFIPNPDGKEEVNHIDGNKLNNVVDNLEWVTKSENALHAFRCGLRKPTSEQIYKAIDSTRKPVRNITTGETYRSLTDAAEAIGGRLEGISKCVTGRRKRYMGMQFEYCGV